MGDRDGVNLSLIKKKIFFNLSESGGFING